MAASIYYNTDVGASNGAEWKYLGYLSNDKPSAVYRVGGFGAEQNANFVEIGISFESITTIEALECRKSTSLVPSSSPDIIGWARRMGENLFNYISSFSRQASELDPQMTVVPLRTVEEWFNQMVRRLTADPEAAYRQINNASMQ